MLGEARDAAHGGWAKQDAANDLGDDTRLADLLEGKAKDASDNNDDGSLNDKESKRIRGFKLGGISAANDAVSRAWYQEAWHDGRAEGQGRVIQMQKQCLSDVYAEVEYGSDTRE